MQPRLALIVTGLGVLWYGPDAVRAQAVRGRVVEEASLRAVSNALVTVVDSAGGAVGATLTDSIGRFTLALSAGTYTFAVRRGRGDPVSTPPLTIAAAVQELQITIALGPGRTVLDTITVVGAAPPYVPARLDDFHARRVRGWGAFLTREEIEQRGAPNVTALVGTVPGVRVVRVRTAYGTLRTVRITGKSCPPRLWVDGVPWGPVDTIMGQGIDVVLFPSELEAVEVYRRASEMPAEFGGSDAMCGVITAWTRRSP